MPPRVGAKSEKERRRNENKRKTVVLVLKNNLLLQHFVPNCCQKVVLASMGKSNTPLGRWFQGLIFSSIFTLAYFLAPSHGICALLALFFRWPSLNAAILFALPILISAVLPPVASPWLLKQLHPILDYFEYEQIIESSPIDARENLRRGENYIIAAQPHGVLSLFARCSAVNAEDEFRGTFPTGVASALLMTPILKHVMGIFNLISASKSVLKKQLKKKGIAGTVVLYVGGMADGIYPFREMRR